VPGAIAAFVRHSAVFHPAVVVLFVMPAATAIFAAAFVMSGTHVFFAMTVHLFFMSGAFMMSVVFSAAATLFAAFMTTGTAVFLMMLTHFFFVWQFIPPF
jgi:hypothetical protein